MNTNNPTTAIAEVEKNPFTGKGYDLARSMGRLTRLADYFNNEKVKGTIQAVLPENSKGFVASVLNEIRKSAADPEKDLSGCTPQSIVNCCVDAANLRLAIDGRQHAHLIKRKDEATLQIGYRGYLARLGGSLNGFVPVVECVYQGDDIKVSRRGDEAIVEHTPLHPFGQRKDSEIIGAYAYLSWESSPGHRSSVVETMDRAEINKVMAAAKTKFVWNSWFSEKVKVAVVRRACKFHFSSQTHDLDEKDNEGFDLTQSGPVTEETTAISERIGKGLDGSAPAVEVMPEDEAAPEAETVNGSQE